MNKRQVLYNIMHEIFKTAPLLVFFELSKYLYVFKLNVINVIAMPAFMMRKLENIVIFN